MIKTLLVPATGGNGDSATFAAALAVARRFAAHIDFLYARVDPIEAAVAMTSDAAGIGGVLLQGSIDRLENDVRDREVQARQLFDRFCARHRLVMADAPVPRQRASVSAQWHVETGDEARWTTAYGLAADLIVAGRGAPGDAGSETTLGTLLVESGRPLLIPGPAATPAKFDRIAIAWKPSPPAARAVSAALPFLTAAKAVVIITIAEDDDDADDGKRLAESLAWHGVQAATQQIAPQEDGEAAALLAAAADRADLLVMGGYSHSRLREWVFGGFTQQVLAAAPVPVLMTH